MDYFHLCCLLTFSCIPHHSMSKDVVFSGSTRRQLLGTSRANDSRAPTFSSSRKDGTAMTNKGPEDYSAHWPLLRRRIKALIKMVNGSIKLYAHAEKTLVKLVDKGDHLESDARNAKNRDRLRRLDRISEAPTLKLLEGQYRKLKHDVAEIREVVDDLEDSFEKDKLDLRINRLEDELRKRKEFLDVDDVLNSGYSELAATLVDTTDFARSALMEPRQTPPVPVYRFGDEPGEQTYLSDELERLHEETDTLTAGDVVRLPDPDLQKVAEVLKELVRPETRTMINRKRREARAKTSGLADAIDKALATEEHGDSGRAANIGERLKGNAPSYEYASNTGIAFNADTQENTHRNGDENGRSNRTHDNDDSDEIPESGSDGSAGRDAVNITVFGAKLKHGKPSKTQSRMHGGQMLQSAHLKPRQRVDIRRRSTSSVDEDAREIKKAIEERAQAVKLKQERDNQEDAESLQLKPWFGPTKVGEQDKNREEDDDFQEEFEMVVDEDINGGVGLDDHDEAANTNSGEGPITSTDVEGREDIYKKEEDGERRRVQDKGVHPLYDPGNMNLEEATGSLLFWQRQLDGLDMAEKRDARIAKALKQKFHRLEVGSPERNIIDGLDKDGTIRGPFAQSVFRIVSEDSAPIGRSHGLQSRPGKPEDEFLHRRIPDTLENVQDDAEAEGGPGESSPGRGWDLASILGLDDDDDDDDATHDEEYRAEKFGERARKNAGRENMAEFSLEKALETVEGQAPAENSSDGNAESWGDPDDSYIDLYDDFLGDPDEFEYLKQLANISDLTPSKKRKRNMTRALRKDPEATAAIRSLNRAVKTLHDTRERILQEDDGNLRNRIGVIKEMKKQIAMDRYQKHVADQKAVKALEKDVKKLTKKRMRIYEDMHDQLAKAYKQRTHNARDNWNKYKTISQQLSRNSDVANNMIYNKPSDTAYVLDET